MVAKTDRKQKWIARIGGLVANAIGLIEREKRSPEMVERLIMALQLFKENSLGDVHRSDIKARRRRLRQRFYALTYRRFMHQDGVPMAELRPSGQTSATFFLRGGNLMLLKDIVRLDYDALCDRVGVDAADEMKQLLEPHGLYLGMPDGEIAEAFGT